MLEDSSKIIFSSKPSFFATFLRNPDVEAAFNFLFSRDFPEISKDSQEFHDFLPKGMTNFEYLHTLNYHTGHYLMIVLLNNKDGAANFLFTKVIKISSYLIII